MERFNFTIVPLDSSRLDIDTSDIPPDYRIFVLVQIKSPFLKAPLPDKDNFFGRIPSTEALQTASAGLILFKLKHKILLPVTNRQTLA